MSKNSNFIAKQYLNAIDPQNFLFSNPALFSKTMHTGGLNLIEGWQQLLKDLDPITGQLRISRFDKDAFQLGKNIACTKGHVVFKNELIELICYTPTRSKTHSIPLLIIPPWINKYYILDLSPKNSLVAALLQQGITVYMISWVNPNITHSHKSLWDYMYEGPICALQFIQQIHKSKINALGFCLGGTLLSMLSSYLSTFKYNPLNSASYLATLIDFSELGDVEVYLNPYSLLFIAQHIKLYGYLSGELLNLMFSTLRSQDLIWSFITKNYLHGEKPKPIDFLYWNADVTNLPATMYLEYLNWMLLDNNLIKPNQIILNNIPLNIQNTNIPAFFVATQNDHIAPWQTVYKGFKAMGGDKQFILGESGHIAGIINPTTQKKYGYYACESIFDTPAEWQKNATFQATSWWVAWFKWLKNLSGEKISATQNFPTNLIMPAPGEYIHK